MPIAKSDRKPGRSPGKENKPRKKHLTAAQRSAAAKKAAETKKRLKAEKAAELGTVDQGLMTGSTAKKNDELFEQILESGGAAQNPQNISKPSTTTEVGPLSEGQSEAGPLQPSDIAEWLGWPFMLWANSNELADLCLSDEEKLSLAGPLCRIANRHNIEQYVNPDLLDGITAAGRLTPIMFRRFAIIAAERKKRAAQGSAAEPTKAGDGSPADVTSKI